MTFLHTNICRTDLRRKKDQHQPTNNSQSPIILKNKLMMFFFPLTILTLEVIQIDFLFRVNIIHFRLSPCDKIQANSLNCVFNLQDTVS